MAPNERRLHRAIRAPPLPFSPAPRPLERHIRRLGAWAQAFHATHRRRRRCFRERSRRLRFGCGSMRPINCTAQLVFVVEETLALWEPAADHLLQIAFGDDRAIQLQVLLIGSIRLQPVFDETFCPPAFSCDVGLRRVTSGKSQKLFARESPSGVTPEMNSWRRRKGQWEAKPNKAAVAIYRCALARQ